MLYAVFGPFDTKYTSTNRVILLTISFSLEICKNFDASESNLTAIMEISPMRNSTSEAESKTKSGIR